MPNKIFLVFVLLLRAAHGADLEELEGDKAAELRADWKEFQKEKLYTDKELIDLLKKGYSITSIASQFKPVVKKKKTYAVPARLVATLSKNGKEAPRSYGFAACKDLLSLIGQKVPAKNMGSAPYVVTYGDYFVTHDGKELSEAFRRNCESREGEENSYACPEYTWAFAEVMAKAGPVLALSEGHDGGGGCGPPYHSSSVRTIDLRTDKTANITDFFEEDALMEALRKDPAYGDFLKKLDVAPRTITDLPKSVRPLRGFAIYDLNFRGGKVRIRWAWDEDNCGMCPNGFEWLGLDVKPKPWFLEELKKLGKRVEKAP